FGYTKLTGELTRTAFQTTSATAIAYEYFVQGTHTLTPRIFASARNEASSAPPAYAGVFRGQRTRMKLVEATVGYRLTPPDLASQQLLCAPLLHRAGVGPADRRLGRNRPAPALASLSSCRDARRLLHLGPRVRARQPSDRSDARAARAGS